MRAELGDRLVGRGGGRAAGAVGAGDRERTGAPQQVTGDLVVRQPDGDGALGVPQASDEACSSTSVSPPGQNASASFVATGGTTVTSPTSVDASPMSTGTGIVRPRFFAASRAATAGGVKASAATPYTVSVGISTSSPVPMAAAAASSPAARASGSEQS